MDGNMGPLRETQNQKEKGPEPTAPTPFTPEAFYRVPVRVTGITCATRSSAAVPRVGLYGE